MAELAPGLEEIGIGEDRPCRQGEDCIDPETGQVSMAEVEVDGDHRFWVCGTCGFEFGYEKVQSTTDASCGIGVPENIRRAASANGAPRPEPGLVPISIGKRPGL